MWARRLTYKLMVAAPFILMTAIAVNSRTYNDGWSTLEAGPELNERIGAYVEPARAVAALQWKGQNLATDQEVRDVANQWVIGAKLGKLKPLIPAHFGDSTEFGVKEQILSANTTLARRMQIVARNDLLDGRPLLAARDLTLTIKLCDVLKYSDLISLSALSSEQIRTLKLIDEIGPKLDRTVVRSVISELERSRGQTRQLVEMLVKSRNLYSTQADREGSAAVRIVDQEPFVALTSIVRSQRPNAESLKSIRNMIVASRGDIPMVITLAKIAWLRQSDFEKKASETVSALRKLSAMP